MRLNANAAHGQRKRNPSGRAESTVKLYAQRVQSRLLLSVRKRTIDEESPPVVSPVDVVRDLIEQAQETATGPARLKLQTFNQYRAALLWYLAAQRDKPEYLDAYNLLAQTRTPAGARRRALTATESEALGVTQRAPARRKSIPYEHLRKLLAAIGARIRPRNTMPSFCQQWIMATLGVGARPIEWFGVEWIDRDAGIVRVPTAKRHAALPAFIALQDSGDPTKTVHDLPSDNVSETSAGEQADSDFDGSDDIQQEAIDESAPCREVTVHENLRLYVATVIQRIQAVRDSAMANGQDPREEYTRLYNCARRIISRACKVAFGNQASYNLYTFRSQFSANSKVTHTLDDVSGMMGHTNSSTTDRSYASRNRAHRGLTPQVLQSASDSRLQVIHSDLDAVFGPLGDFGITPGGPLVGGSSDAQ